MEGLAKTELLPLEMSISLVSSISRACEGLSSTEARVRGTFLLKHEKKLQHALSPHLQG